MKKNKILIVVWICTFIITILGTTFSYFNAANGSNENEVAAGSSNLGIGLSVLPLYKMDYLIPTNDSDIITAYNHQCVDINDRSACQAYEIVLQNSGQAMNFDGVINFTLSDITNLSYLVLDENDNVYVNSTSIVSGTDQSLGNTVQLGANSTASFKLLIWLSNKPYEQSGEDALGNFTAAVTYTSTQGSRITGLISG